MLTSNSILQPTLNTQLVKHQHSTLSTSTFSHPFFNYQQQKVRISIVRWFSTINNIRYQQYVGCWVEFLDLIVNVTSVGKTAENPLMFFLLFFTTSQRDGICIGSLLTDRDLHPALLTKLWKIKLYVTNDAKQYVT